MGVTKIEWTATRSPDGSTFPGYTFNPWRGCEKVSPACQHCYAEKTSKRNPAVLGQWGPGTNRVIAAESYWKLPIRWNKDAKKAGHRRKVFCASLADVFENREDLVEHRARLFELINETPHLDWLLLTKRPDRIKPHLEQIGVWEHLPLPNVWFGTTVENQEYADKRIPELCKIPAVVRFLSVEPLLGPVDLRSVVYDNIVMIDCLAGKAGFPVPHADFEEGQYAIDWVIVGGESGSKARPMHRKWVYKVLEDCELNGVPFFFKQWGKWAPSCERLRDGVQRFNTAQTCWMTEDGKVHSNFVDGKLDEPVGEVLHIRDLGKKLAGRLLNQRTYDGMPNL